MYCTAVHVMDSLINHTACISYHHKDVSQGFAELFYSNISSLTKALAAWNFSNLSTREKNHSAQSFFIKLCLFWFNSVLFHFNKMRLADFMKLCLYCLNWLLFRLNRNIARWFEFIHKKKSKTLVAFKAFFRTANLCLYSR